MQLTAVRTFYVDVEVIRCISVMGAISLTGVDCQCSRPSLSEL